MRLFTFPPHRSIRLSLIGTALLTAALVTPASARLAHDQNLDDADNAIQKALALLDEVQGLSGPPRAARRFEAHLKLADLALQVARDQVQAAADLQDSITP